MLEMEIKALREEIIMLRETITAMGENIIQKPKEKKAAPAAPAQAAPLAPAAPAPVAPAAPAQIAAPTPAPAAPATVTRDDLQNLCMTIVRADRSKREAIQATISKFGAENLVAIKGTDFHALHAALEALK